MSGHQLYQCERPCPNQGTCQYCDGGLALCDVCGGAEGSLPTECPGEAMTEQQSDAVYAGTLNYRDGKWWRQTPMEAEVARLRAERDRLRAAMQRAADQLKRHPSWDSHISGTWVILDDALALKEKDAERAVKDAAALREAGQ